MIEFALILPLLVLLLFSVMEYGWLFMRIQQVTNAAREGVRKAVLPDTTNEEVLTQVSGIMTAFGMGSGAHVTTTTPADITTAAVGDIVTVSVSIPAENAELLGIPLFPLPSNLRSSASMAKEGPDPTS